MGDGAMDKLKGKGKEAVGKLTGDHRKEAEGKADQAEVEPEDAADGLTERARASRTPSAGTTTSSPAAQSRPEVLRAPAVSAGGTVVWLGPRL